jgi:hypothetical protein
VCRVTLFKDSDHDNLKNGTMGETSVMRIARTVMSNRELCE